MNSYYYIICCCSDFHLRHLSPLGSSRMHMPPFIFLSVALLFWYAFIEVHVLAPKNFFFLKTLPKNFFMFSVKLCLLMLLQILSLLVNIILDWQNYSMKAWLELGSDLYSAIVNPSWDWFVSLKSYYL